MEDQLICPVCSRDYELPRRYTIRSDDTDFFIVPRLLRCLHTCCQSCLEEIWEKNNSEGVYCPQCHHYEALRGVKYLPLDGSAISQLIPLDGASLSFCSRCRDEVPSFSWCEICSATLCEFHHQDHKLSAITAKHNVLTFKVIFQEKISIEPRMPPISCPEEIEQDASLYCHDCNLLVSSQVKFCLHRRLLFPQAMFTKHTNHRCSESSALENWAKDLINFSLASSLQRQESLIKAIKGTRSTLKDLDRNREIAEEDIRSVFQDVRSRLDEREREMLDRLDDIVTRKQEIISSQLEGLSQALEKCRHAIFVAESLLNRTEKVKGSGPYLVSAAQSISRRGEDIDEEIMHTPFEPQTDSFLRGYFVRQEIEALKTIILSLGGILTQDNIPGGPNQEERKINSIQDESPHKIRPVEHQLTFTVRTRPPPKLSVEKKQSTSKEAVIVEARLKTLSCQTEKTESTFVNHQRAQLCTPDSLILLHRLNYETLLSDCATETSLDELLGGVVGQVVLLTEVDTQIVSKHRVRSNYESFYAEDSGLPTFRVTREIVGEK